MTLERQKGQNISFLFGKLYESCMHSECNYFYKGLNCKQVYHMFIFLCEFLFFQILIVYVDVAHVNFSYKFNKCLEAHLIGKLTAKSTLG